MVFEDEYAYFRTISVLPLHKKSRVKFYTANYSSSLHADLRPLSSCLSLEGSPSRRKLIRIQ